MIDELLLTSDELNYEPLIFNDEIDFFRRQNTPDEHSTGIPDMLSDLVEDPNDHTNSGSISDLNTTLSHFLSTNDSVPISESQDHLTIDKPTTEIDRSWAHTTDTGPFSDFLNQVDNQTLQPTPDTLINIPRTNAICDITDVEI